MKPNPKGVKDRLLADAELMIDELLEWDENNEAPTLTQIEDIVLKLRKRMSEKMALALVENQEKQQPIPGPGCPQCGAEMRYKGQKGSKVESLAGELELERGYYHCKECKQGNFPPG